MHTLVPRTFAVPDGSGVISRPVKELDRVEEVDFRWSKPVLRSLRVATAARPGEVDLLERYGEEKGRTWAASLVAGSRDAARPLVLEGDWPASARALAEG